MSSSFANSLCHKFNQGQYEDLIRHCEGLNLESNKEMRISLHYQGMAWAALGSMWKAQSLFERALTYGSNVQIIRDLACAYYQNEDIENWRETYKKLKVYCDEFGEKLSFASRFSCELTLAKFYEEEGRLGTALKIYRRLGKMDEAKSPSRAYFQVAPQILRLKSFFQCDEELSEVYTELMTASHDNISSYWGIEIEHSLMLAELVIVGPKHAYERLQQALETDLVGEIDKRLMAFDFIEEFLIRKLPLPKKLHGILANMDSGFSRYEQQVFDLAFSEATSIDIPYRTLAKSLPLGCYLRLITLGLAKSGGSEFKEELQKKINLILTGFEADDRNYWAQRLRPFVTDQELILELDRINKSVMFHSRKTQLSRKRVAYHLMELLLERKEWEVEDVIKTIWQSQYTPEHFNRLRMTVHRTNQLLFELTSLEKCIEMSGESLGLNANVKLQSSETRQIH